MNPSYPQSLKASWQVIHFYLKYVGKKNRETAVV